MYRVPDADINTANAGHSYIYISVEHIKTFASTDLLANNYCIFSIMITGLAHINLLVPPGTLDQAYTFYEETLGLTAAEVPPLQKGTIAW